MKKALTVSRLLFAIMLLGATCALAAGHARITADELQDMMKSPKGMVIVDVREPELFTAGHIPGAINIPYDDSKGRVLKELKPEQKIVFVCHGGPMGDELGTILSENGYKSVYNLKGGMRKWNGPLAKGAR